MGVELPKDWTLTGPPTDISKGGRTKEQGEKLAAKALVSGCHQVNIVKNSLIQESWPELACCQQLEHRDQLVSGARQIRMKLRCAAVAAKLPGQPLGLRQMLAARHGITLLIYVHPFCLI
jgi:hypothetical protein